MHFPFGKYFLWLILKHYSYFLIKSIIIKIYFSHVSRAFYSISYLNIITVFYT